LDKLALMSSQFSVLSLESEWSLKGTTVTDTIDC